MNNELQLFCLNFYLMLFLLMSCEIYNNVALHYYVTNFSNVTIPAYYKTNIRLIQFSNCIPSELIENSCLPAFFTVEIFHPTSNNDLRASTLTGGFLSQPLGMCINKLLARKANEMVLFIYRTCYFFINQTNVFMEKKYYFNDSTYYRWL